MGARRGHLCRVTCGGLVHRDDAESLQATGAVEGLNDDSRPFMGALVTVATQAGHMQQHIGHAVIGDDEAKTLASVKPLDRSDDLDRVEAGIGGTARGIGMRHGAVLLRQAHGLITIAT